MWPALANAIHDAAISPVLTLRGAMLRRSSSCAPTSTASACVPQSAANHTIAGGQVELKLKTPWCDGTTHLRILPLELMQQPVATVVGTLTVTGYPCERQVCGGKSWQADARFGSEDRVRLIG